MYTNFERLHVLEAVRASMTRYNGPLGILGDTPEGVDDDIWDALEQVRDLIDRRIEEVNNLDFEKEAV